MLKAIRSHSHSGCLFLVLCHKFCDVWRFVIILKYSCFHGSFRNWELCYYERAVLCYLSACLHLSYLRCSSWAGKTLVKNLGNGLQPLLVYPGLLGESCSRWKLWPRVLHPLLCQLSWGHCIQGISSSGAVELKLCSFGCFAVIKSLDEDIWTQEVEISPWETELSCWNALQVTHQMVFSCFDLICVIVRRTWKSPVPPALLLWSELLAAASPAGCTWGPGSLCSSAWAPSVQPQHSHRLWLQLSCLLPCTVGSSSPLARSPAPLIGSCVPQSCSSSWSRAVLLGCAAGPWCPSTCWELLHICCRTWQEQQPDGVSSCLGFFPYCCFAALKSEDCFQLGSCSQSQHCSK